MGDNVCKMQQWQERSNSIEENSEEEFWSEGRFKHLRGGTYSRVQVLTAKLRGGSVNPPHLFQVSTR